MQLTKCCSVVWKPCHDRYISPQSELGISLDKGYVERLLAYGRSVSHFPTAIKEFPWRNGWFVEISKRELGKGLPDPMPLHSALLASVGAL